MSQAGDISATAGPVPPSVATRYDTNDANYAVPQSSRLNVFGNNTASPANNGYMSYTTSLGLGTGKTVWVNSHGTYKWVVNPIAGVGTHTTITSALASAAPTDVIFVTPGTYNESIILTQKATLTGPICDPSGITVFFTGTISTNGFELNVSYFAFDDSSSSHSIVTGGNTTNSTNLDSCYFYINGNAVMLNHTNSNASSVFSITNCKGDYPSTSSGAAFFANQAIFQISETSITNSGLINSTPSSSNNDFIIISNSGLNFPIATSGSSSLNLFSSIINTSDINVTAIDCNGSGLNFIDFSAILSGTAVCVNVQNNCTISNTGLDSTNTNVVSGNGTLTYSDVTFSDTSSNFSTSTTQVPLVVSNFAMKVITPGAYPYTTHAQDQLILVDTSAARTIVPLANPTTGQKHIIKDSVGTAGANNITVTPSGKNIDGAASFVINVNYGSITIVYSGSQWLIV